MAIGHVRYSTTGGGSWENSQPVWRDDGREVALAHNGNLTNAVELYNELTRSRDLVPRHLRLGDHRRADLRRGRPEPIENAVAAVMQRLEGAYSTVVMTKRAWSRSATRTGSARCRSGKLGDRFCVASESSAFDIIGARADARGTAGRAGRAHERGLETRQVVPADRPALCVFEHIYFSRPDSRLEGRVLQEVRGPDGRDPRRARRRPTRTS